MGCGEKDYSDYLYRINDVEVWMESTDENQDLSEIYFEFYELSKKMRFNKEESEMVDKILDKFESLVESLVHNRTVHDNSTKDALRKQVK